MSEYFMHSLVAFVHILYETFCLMRHHQHFIFSLLYLSQFFARSETDTRILAYSEGALIPCSVSADMTLAQTTVELVKVRN